MSKIIDATCENEKVTAETVEVAEAEILSAGKGASSGILIIQGGKAVYLTSGVGDLETTLDKLVSSLNKIADTLDAIGTGMTGSTTAPPPTLATSTAEIRTTAGELDTLKGALK